MSGATAATSTLIAQCNPFENRQPGDFILVWDQSGSTLNILLRTWTYTDTNGNGLWDKATEPLVLTSGQSLSTTGDAYAATSPDGYRGEAAVNLSDAIFPANPTSCLSIGNVIPGTVTGNSDTADYKDTVLADFTKDLTLSNCGSVRITKDTKPEGGTGRFQYTLSRTGGAPIRYDDGVASTSETSAVGVLTSDGDNETQVDPLPVAATRSASRSSPEPTTRTPSSAMA
jgi:hypothetical protein